MADDKTQLEENEMMDNNDSVVVDIPFEKYSIQIEHFDDEPSESVAANSWVLNGLTTTNTLISLENKNSIYSRLAKTKDNNVLWPGKDKIQSMNINIPAEPGLIKVCIKEGDKTICSIQGLIDLSSPVLENSGNGNRTLTPIQQDYKTKYGNDRTFLLHNLSSYRAIDSNGNAVVLTFNAPSKSREVQLVDMEYILSDDLSSDMDYEAVQFSIDPHSLVHVTGLVMALEDGLAKGTLERTPHIQKQFGLIKQHQEGHTPSTRRMGKLNLVFSQKFETLEEARRIEDKLKKLKRRDYIEKIVKDGLIKITPP